MMLFSDEDMDEGDFEDGVSISSSASSFSFGGYFSPSSSASSSRGSSRVGSLPGTPPPPKRARLRDPPPPPPPRPRPSELGARLYGLRETGDCVDVFLLVHVAPDTRTEGHGGQSQGQGEGQEDQEEGEVEGQVERVGAHKSVLIAMSNVFATMMTPRWTPGESIPVPKNIGITPLNAFLKYLYTETLEENMSDALILDVMFLADHYSVQSLLSLCDELMCGRIMLGNCVDIYQYTRLFEGVRVGKQAFETIKDNANNILRWGDSDRFDETTWESILSLSYLKGVKEVVLFDSFLAWRDDKLEQRSEAFQRLLRLIRFPLMGSRDFAAHVVSAPNVLSPEEIIQLFVYFSIGGTIQNFCSQPRNTFMPKNSTELHAALSEAVAEDIIQLRAGVYTDGPFFLERSRVVICGAEEGTSVLQSSQSRTSALRIVASSCKISKITLRSNEPCQNSHGVTVTGSRNTLKDVVIENGACGISIHGESNIIRCAESNVSDIHVFIKGRRNSVERVSATGGNVGVHVQGSRNSVSLLKCEDVFKGVEIADGNRNLISNVRFSRLLNNKETEGSRWGSYKAVCISKGKKNCLNDVRCEKGMRKLADTNQEDNMENIRDVDWCLILKDKAAYTQVQACGPGMVDLGGRNNKLTDVNGSSLIRIAGRGHHLETCRAVTLSICNQRTRDYELQNCIFSTNKYHE